MLKAVLEGIEPNGGIGNAIAGISQLQSPMMAGKGISIYLKVVTMGDSFTNFIATLGNLDGGLIVCPTGILAVGGTVVPGSACRRNNERLR